MLDLLQAEPRRRYISLCYPENDNSIVLCEQLNEEGDLSCRYQRAVALIEKSRDVVRLLNEVSEALYAVVQAHGDQGFDTALATQEALPLRYMPWHSCWILPSHPAALKLMSATK